MALHQSKVYPKRRAAEVVKDVLPIPSMNSVIYNFECRGCKSRYIGRTLQCLAARIRHHIPLRLLRVHARQSLPRRGRPRKPVEESSLRRDIPQHQEEQRKCQPVAPSISTRSMSRKCPPVVAASDVDVESLQSSIAKHLALKRFCQNVCDDSCFSILSRGRSKYH